MNIDIINKITTLLSPITEFNGAEIVRIAILGHKQSPTIQIMAERHDGTMNISLCEILSREYSLLLDVNQFFSGQYTLEVSSPGIDRPLTRQKDFLKWTGFEAKIETDTPIDDRKRFKGIFDNVQEIEGDFTIDIHVDQKKYTLHFDNIKEAQLTLSDELLKATQDGNALHREALAAEYTDN